MKNPLGRRDIRHYTDLMIFVGAELVPAHNGASTRHCPYKMSTIF